MVNDTIQYEVLKHKSVAELRTMCREKRQDISGLAIAGMRKEELILAILGEEIGKLELQGIEEKARETQNKDSLADILADALQGKIKTNGIDKEEVENIVNTIISKKFIPQTIQIQNIQTQEIKDMGLQHRDFPNLLKLAEQRLDTMLVGPAGSGKTTVCHAIADALSLPFYFQSVGQQTTKSDLLGYTDAQGNYVNTHLRRAYAGGGVFLLDEIDAGNQNVITVLNSMLANGYGSFPDEIVKRHQDFICFAAANTYGKGNDRQYIGRNQLDAASLDRFVTFNFDYDEELEKAITGNTDFTIKIQKIRAIVMDLRLQIVVSPRASIKGMKMFAMGFTESQVLDMLVFKGCNQDIKSKILGAL